jgi:hypothetical protein
VIHSTCEVVQGGSVQYLGALGVFRVSGEALDGAQRLPWRLILKIAASTGEDGPTNAVYWKREALAYQSGLLRSLPGNLRAPACYGVIEWPAHAEQGEAVWIWLEEIPQGDKPPWTSARLQQAARALGHFNGAYLGQDLRQIYPWLGPGRVEEWVAWSEPVLRDLEQNRQHPFMAACVPPESVHRLHTLWLAREELLTPFRRLPRTLCHHDAFVRNLLLEPTAMGERVVAIDWEYLGMGALGEEIGLLMVASHTFLDLEVARIQAVEEHVWAGYVAGLHAAGWQGNVQQVRFAYAATSGLLGAIAMAGAFVPWVVEHLDVAEAMLGHSTAEMTAAWPELLSHMLALGEEALGLAGRI